VNHLGPVLLTELLLNQILASENGRVITISSQGLVAMPRLRVDLTDPEFDRRKFNVTKAYYQAKRAQVMYTYRLAERFSQTNATANSIRVTAVKVDLARHPDLSAFKRWAYTVKSRMSISPAEMAQTYTWLSTSPHAAHTSGRYYNEKNAEVESVPYTYSSENIDAVMRLTATYLPELREVLSSGDKTTD
jgi:NAD(P)-dependent dehydrogenase (short-subunit alcohol dehydrogenase family)